MTLGMTRHIMKVDFAFKTRPMAHQQKAFDLSRDREFFGLFMEQGTGKTKVIIDTAAWLYLTGKITGMLVIAPNGVHQNWVDPELKKHMPDFVQYNALVWGSIGVESKKFQRQFNELCSYNKFSILAMNVDAFSSAKGLEYARKFLNAKMCLLVIDEITRIKNPKAKRTKGIVSLRRLAPYRRGLSGTPFTQGPFDIFAPFQVLDPEVLGFSSFWAFKHYYAIWSSEKNWMQGVNYEKLIAYSNLDELKRVLAPHTFRVTKDECLDLPDKVYQTWRVTLSPTQRSLYEQMSEDLLIEFENGGKITAPMAMTKLLRLRQITGGFLQVSPEQVATNQKPWNPIDITNPKVEAIVEIVGDVQGKIIIWCSFQAEVEMVSTEIKSVFGEESVVLYYGPTEKKARKKALDDFENMDSPVRFLVGTQASGGVGLTMVAASTVIYFSNEYSLEKRLQSEDRAHRIGQSKSVTYIDIEAEKTIDAEIIAALQSKRNLADFMTGDDLRKFLRGEKQNG